MHRLLPYCKRLNGAEARNKALDPLQRKLLFSNDLAQQSTPLMH